MCIKRKNGKYYVTNATVGQLKKLVPYLMKKFNIPKENVVRHYDVNGKKCPNCYTEDNFKTTLIDNKRWKILETKFSGLQGQKIQRTITKKDNQ
jgi:N-acetylmuramoyl-L-alanine amidase